MSSTRVNEHEFLGMNIKFKDKKVKINMKKHIKKAIDAFEDDITRNSVTPATSYLFKTRDAHKLNERRAETFHSVDVMLFFISRRCRLDTQTAIGF